LVVPWLPALPSSSTAGRLSAAQRLPGAAERAGTPALGRAAYGRCLRARSSCKGWLNGQGWSCAPERQGGIQSCAVAGRLAAAQLLPGVAKRGGQNHVRLRGREGLQALLSRCLCVGAVCAWVKGVPEGFH
jgi:hypothetical protein